MRTRFANITGPSSEESGVPIVSTLHTMQVLASFESQKFRSEGRPAREGASRKGARPCPQRASGVVRNSHTFPYDTNCIRPCVQGSCVVWAEAMRYVDELRLNGVLRSSLPSGVRSADGANLVGQPLEERCLTTPATRQVSAAGGGA
jgi:hypothetical protein